MSDMSATLLYIGNQMDDLIEHSSLITVPPALTEDTCNRIIEIFHECASKIGLQ